MSKYLKLFIAIVFLNFAIPAFAEVPRVINYQGRLTDASGDVINGTKAVTFRIYDVKTGGNALWAEDHSITAQKGIFSVLLGSVTPLDIAFDKQYYIEIVVDGVELAPRMAIAASAYAINAAHAETVSNVDGIAKAWVNFDKNGIIKSSKNTANVVKVGLGQYTITWQNSFSDSDYCVITTGSSTRVVGVVNTTQSTVELVVTTANNGTLAEPTRVYVMAFDN